MQKKWIIANWKANPSSVAEARELVSSFDETLAAMPNKEAIGVVICPPFIFLEEIAAMIQKSPMAGRVIMGAQDIAVTDSPAQTGEITGAELVKLGVRYVIVGHSERRKLGESDDMVNKKLQTALADSLTPIVCVGEREYEERFTGVLENQVRATFSGFSTDGIEKCLIAYEPVWAISTSQNARSDTPNSALESVKVIRGILQNEFQGTELHFVYGGSITSHNIMEFLTVPEFDGVLVGGASVHADEFRKILTDAVFLAR